MPHEFHLDSHPLNALSRRRRARVLLGRALRQRCPACGQGRPFRSLFAMRERCDACHYRFEREPGYFMGALYFSYAFGVVLLVPAFVVLAFLDLSPGWTLLIAEAELVAACPLLFRYARLFWMGLDLVLSPVKEGDFEVENG